MAASSFRSAIAIPSKQSKTAQGYLLCADVPLARTGTLLYRAGELGGDVEPGPDGIIRIDRDPEEVFADATLASFNYSAITVDHPEKFVFPVNWKGLAVGLVQNVRRGTGADDNLLLGDMLITDQAAIELVEKGQREVSCGYNSDYEQSTPGQGKQRNIRGNHVALVPRGRCGPICSIGDSAPTDPITGEVVIMSNTPAPAAAPVQAPNVLRVPVPRTMSFKDRIMAAFYTNDAAGLGEALATMDASGGAGPQTIEVHLTPPAGAATAAVATVDADPNSMNNRMKRLEDGLGKLVKAFKDAASKDSDEDEDEDDKKKKTEDADGDDDEDDKDKKKTEDDDDEDEKKGKTEDRLAIFRDHKAKAEILAPGVKLPTLDKAMPKVKFRDSMCAFRRSTLAKSWETKDGKAAILPFLDAASAKSGPDFGKMTCDGAQTIFTGAAAIMSAANMRTTSQATTDSVSRTLYTSHSAETNKRNSNFWEKHGGLPKE